MKLLRGNSPVGSDPGEAEFLTEIEAVEFAKERVAEFWIVHCRGPVPRRFNSDVWIVAWWCQ